MKQKRFGPNLIIFTLFDVISVLVVCSVALCEWPMFIHSRLCRPVRISVTTVSAVELQLTEQL